MREIETGTDHLLAKIDNGVGYLIMNRPDARNAMSMEMNEAMQKNIAKFELDNEVRCIVLTGAGKAFCAGGDVKGMSSRNKEGREEDTIDKANELLLQDAFNADFNDPAMEEDLVNLNGITNEVLSALSSNNIKKLEDLAEMSVGELQDISDTISEKEASALIMEARKPWFE